MANRFIDSLYGEQKSGVGLKKQAEQNRFIRSVYGERDAEPQGLKENRLSKETDEGGIISTLFENLSRGNYAAGNLALELSRGNIKDAADAYEAAKEGFSLEKKTSFIDVMDEVTPGWHPWARTGVGFVGDVVIDPVNLLPMAWFGKAGRLLKLDKLAKTGDDLIGLSRAARKVGQVVGDLAPVDSLGKKFIPGWDLRKTPGAYDSWRDLQLHLNDVRREVQKEFRERWDLFRTVSKKLGKDPKDAAAEMVRLRELGLPQNVDEAFKPFYDEVSKGLDNLALREVTHGILDPKKVKENYFPHIYERGTVVEEGGKLVTKQQKGFYTNLKYRSAPFFTKAREFGNLEDAKKWIVSQRAGGKVEKIAPVDNWFRGYAIRRFVGESAIAWKGFIDTTLKNPEFAKPLKDFLEVTTEGGEAFLKAKLPKGYSFVTSATNLRAPRMTGMLMKELKQDIQEAAGGDMLLTKIFRKSGGKGIIELSNEEAFKLAKAGGKEDIYLMPTEFAQTIKNTFKVFGSDEQTKGFLRAIDKGVNMWKTMATAMRWPFHMRNAISNQWLTYQAGVDALQLPQRIAEAAAVQLKAKGVQGWTAKEMLGIADRYGVRAYGWMGADIPKMFNKELFIIEKRSKLARAVGAGDQLWNPFQTWSRAGAKVGTGIEDNSRLAVFIDQLKKRGLKKGMDEKTLVKGFKEAAAHTRKHLFDYTELTDFERNVMKRVFPFYTWMRKNIPAQLKGLVEHPEKWARLADFERDFFPDHEASPEERDAFENSWLGSERAFRTPWQTKDGRSIYYQVDLPIEDLQKSVKMRTWISGLTPVYTLSQVAANVRTWPEVDKLMKPGDRERAPWYVAYMPQAMQKLVGVSPIVDRRTGKIHLGMDPQWKYALKTTFPFLNDWDKVFPQGPTLVAEAEDKKLQLISYASGVRFRGFDAEQAQLNRYYRSKDAMEQVRRLSKKRTDLTAEEARAIFEQMTKP